MPNDNVILQQLIFKRGQVKAQLTRFRSYVNSRQEQPNQTVEHLQTRLEKALQLWDRFETIQGQIEEHDTAEEQNRERLAFEGSYFDTIALAKQVLSQQHSVNHPVNATQNGGNEQHAAQVKLPVITLPTFSGAYDEWLHFHDMFQSLIHNNQSLSAVQRFQYLKSAVTGEAAQVIDSLSISDVNYATAWQLLKERYDNKKLIINNHVTALFELPSIPKESHVAIRQLIDHTQKHLRALKTLEQPTEHWDTLIIHLIVKKLDYTSKREWEATIKNVKSPTLDQLMDCLKGRAQVLESIQSTSNTATFKQPQHKQSSYTNKQNCMGTKSHLIINNPVKCMHCKGNHAIYKCADFLKLSISDRITEVKKQKACTNCFKAGHYALDCNAGNCRICKGKHNTLLHIDKPNTRSNSNDSNTEEASTTSMHCAQPTKQILLSTAKILLIDRNGKSHVFRALLDSGSQSNFISQDACKRLQLACNQINIPVIGINQVKTNISLQTKVTMKSRFGSFQEDITCLVLPHITDDLPNVKITALDLKIPENITLADPDFNVPCKIDLLLGAELFWNLLCVGQFKAAKNQPTFQKTLLGWVIAGPIQTTQLQANKLSVNLSLQHQLEKFWEIETVENRAMQSPNDIICENHFKDTLKISEDDGRYIVNIPFRKETSNLGESRSQAVQRLNAMEKRFNKDENLKEQYIKFMQEYEEMGHMTPISSDDQSTSHYYLPHHAVIKNTSNTTKLRVVFDASCKTNNGISLNDIMHIGPTIQEDLLSIILRFRIHNYVITADIAKMYRQIYIDENQQNLQRIVWRKDENEPIQSYQLTTVTYGTAAAPFLAIRSLHEVANENESRYPQASKTIRKDFYVDDLITGATTIEETKQLANDLMHILQTRGFELRQWTSNNNDILQELANSKTDAPHAFIVENQEKRTLGLLWNPKTDTFQYKVQTESHENRTTKRTILSTISKLFDPLGLVGPTIIIAKPILQQLWQLKLDWDESVPIKLHTMWTEFYKNLHELNNLNIPRHVLCVQPVDIQLHGFADASTLAYGACLYIRSTDSEGNVQVQLATAKSRVAPLKSVSLPRLELCAALLLAQLVKKYQEATNLNFAKCFYWSDSTVTLAWINGMPNQWKTFVSNRVSEIQQLTTDGHWNHVSSSENPADVISRGVTANKLINHSIWWHGPHWLGTNQWPTSHKPLETTEEAKSNILSLAAVSTEEMKVLSKFSKWTKLQRTMAYCLRFLYNSKKKNKEKRTKELTVEELEVATLKIIYVIQNQCFLQEIQDLQKKGTVSTKSKLLQLSPYLDEQGLVRVGGRIRYANVTNDQKHPLILPKGHHVTYLIIQQEHLKLHHCSHEQLLSAIRHKFWPLSGRQMVKNITRKCLQCFKVKPRKIQHMMGDLPEHRIVAASRPFTITGVDYAGPVQIREGRRRGKPITTKGYICIFVCFNTKAIHIELVTNLTSDCFIASLRRFISRRGFCHTLYSDNGTNFIGANAKLKELYEFLKKNDDSIKSNLAMRKINWKFIPPKAPHFGGLWEASVKAVKTHLYKTIQNSMLTFEEYNTLLVEIEGILNSRPLTPLSTNPNDLFPLTPAHFLIGDSLIDPVDRSYVNVPENRLNQWQKIQQIKQHFWRRWHLEYLHQLQVRAKWHTKTPNVEVGTLTLLIEDNLPPLRWITGRIVAVHPGKDNIVRVVTVKTASGTYKRPVSKLCPLPIET